MVKKLITFSFAPESIGGFCCICNGVQTVREKHFSACIPMTKHAFIEAVKDRVKFNELLGIDIRDGWQNALKDAIEPFVTMTEDCDPAVVAQAVAQADVNVRGQEAVEKDMAVLEKDNEELVAKVEEETKQKEIKEELQEFATAYNKNEDPVKAVKKLRAKKSQKKAKNDERRDDTVAVVSENDGCTENTELPAENPSTPDNA